MKWNILILYVTLLYINPSTGGNAGKELKLRKMYELSEEIDNTLKSERGLDILIQTAFKQFNVSNTEYITKDNWEALLESNPFKEEMTNEFLSSQGISDFTILDINNDGRLDKEEARLTMRKVIAIVRDKAVDIIDKEEDLNSAVWLYNTIIKEYVKDIKKVRTGIKHNTMIGEEMMNEKYGRIEDDMNMTMFLTSEELRNILEMEYNSLKLPLLEDEQFQALMIVYDIDSNSEITLEELSPLVESLFYQILLTKSEGLIRYQSKLKILHERLRSQEGVNWKYENLPPQEETIDNYIYELGKLLINLGDEYDHATMGNYMDTDPLTFDTFIPTVNNLLKEIAYIPVISTQKLKELFTLADLDHTGVIQDEQLHSCIRSFILYLQQLLLGLRQKLSS